MRITTDGLVVACTICGNEQLLPYTSNDHAAVSIMEIIGWTSPPLLCPECEEFRMTLRKQEPVRDSNHE